MLQNLGFYVVLGQEGAGGGKIGILRAFQHRWPKHGPNIAPKMAQHRPNIGQHRPNIGRLLGRRPAVRRISLKPLNNLQLPPKASGKDTGCVAGGRISRLAPDSRAPAKQRLLASGVERLGRDSLRIPREGYVELRQAQCAVPACMEAVRAYVVVVVVVGPILCQCWAYVGPLFGSLADNTTFSENT